MNKLKNIFKELSDKELKSILSEILEDDIRNDGVINSKKHREIAKKVGEINNQNTSTNLFLVQVAIYKEACLRFIKN